MNLLGRALKAVARGFFRLFYELDITGMEHIPPEGPVILAANHINFFDAPLLLAFAPRPLYFVAAAPAFEVPVWASLMKLYGTIPVERGKSDVRAIRAALEVLKSGRALGIFPEGTFTDDGHTVPAKHGTALLAIKTGAPVVPVTITGAFRSWPRLGPLTRRLPRPWRIGITFHEPIVLDREERERHRRDRAFEEELTRRIMDSLDRTLEPAIRAEERISRLVAERGPGLRLYELFPLFLSLSSALLLGIGTGWFSHPETSVRALQFLIGFLAVAVAYFSYLVWDVGRARQTVLSRALRSLSPFLFLVLYYPLLVESIPLMAEVRHGVSAAYPRWIEAVGPPISWMVVDWLFLSYFAVIPYVLLGLRYYHFRKYLLLQKFSRGLLLCTYAALLTIIFLPPVGGYYPLAVAVDSLGLLAPLVGQYHLSRLVVASFPTVIVTLTVYCLLFDLAYRRSTFYAMLFPAAGGIASAVFLRGYPLSAVAVNVLITLLIILYMRVLPMRAHDGRLV